MEKPTFGDEVRSLVTNVKGIVVSISTQLHGVDRYGLQPQSKDEEKLPEGIETDCIAFDILVKGKVKRPADLEIPKHDLELGDKVEDTVTGFKGTVTSFTEFFNGCVYARVRGTVSNKDEEAKYDFQHVHRFKKIEPAKEKRESYKSGGPDTKISRASNG